jgi:hypothetical protein
MTFSGLHGIIHKIILLITTAVRTSNPTSTEMSSKRPSALSTNRKPQSRKARKKIA